MNAKSTAGDRPNEAALSGLRRIYAIKARVGMHGLRRTDMRSSTS